MHKFLFLALFTLTGMQLFAQGRTITGRVTDADNGEYIPGVTSINGMKYLTAVGPYPSFICI